MDFNAFKARCKEKGYSPSMFAEKELKISKSCVSSWKAGRNPEANTLIKISQLLDCSVDYLLGLDQIPERASQLTQAVPVADKKEHISQIVNKALEMYFFFEQKEVKNKIYGGIEDE